MCLDKLKSIAYLQQTINYDVHYRKSHSSFILINVKFHRDCCCKFVSLSVYFMFPVLYSSLQDAQGQTALHVACQNGHKSVSIMEIFRLLESHLCSVQCSGSSELKTIYLGLHQSVQEIRLCACTNVQEIKELVIPVD